MVVSGRMHLENKCHGQAAIETMIIEFSHTCLCASILLCGTADHALGVMKEGTWVVQLFLSLRRLRQKDKDDGHLKGLEKRIDRATRSAGAIQVQVHAHSLHIPFVVQSNR